MKRPRVTGRPLSPFHRQPVEAPEAIALVGVAVDLQFLAAEPDVHLVVAFVADVADRFA
jgi:hypothetical protein